MKLKSKKPCPECPWRKCHPRGWLGGHDPYLYPDLVAANSVPACHRTVRFDYDPGDHVCFCVGALQTMNNQCILPREPAGAADAAEAVGQSDECFRHVRDFYEYHTGEPYIPPIERMLIDRKRMEEDDRDTKP